MKRFTKIVGVALVAASILPIVVPSSDAATVRRHLRCAAPIPGISITTPFGQSNNYPIQITNQWALTIPANTTYTVRIGNKSFNHKRGPALAQGQSFSLNVGYKVSQCDVTVPG
jgi:hypothetical protein